MSSQLFVNQAIVKKQVLFYSNMLFNVFASQILFKCSICLIDQVQYFKITSSYQGDIHSTHMM